MDFATNQLNSVFVILSGCQILLKHILERGKAIAVSCEMVFLLVYFFSSLKTVPMEQSYSSFCLSECCFQLRKEANVFFC